MQKRSLEIKNVINISEYRTQELIKPIVSKFGDDYKVLPEVGLAAAFSLDSLEPRTPLWSQCLNGRFDFLVVRGKLCQPILAIEFDGPIHLSDRKKMENDRLKNELCEMAGLPLIRIGKDELNDRPLDIRSYFWSASVDERSPGSKFVEFAIWHIASAIAIDCDEREKLEAIKDKYGLEETEFKKYVSFNRSAYRIYEAYESNDEADQAARTHFELLADTLPISRSVLKQTFPSLRWALRCRDAGFSLENQAFASISDVIQYYSHLRFYALGTDTNSPAGEIIARSSKTASTSGVECFHRDLDDYELFFDKVPRIAFRRINNARIEATAVLEGFPPIASMPRGIVGFGLDPNLLDHALIAYHTLILLAQCADRADAHEVRRQRRRLESLPAGEREKNIRERQEKSEHLMQELALRREASDALLKSQPWRLDLTQRIEADMSRFAWNWRDFSGLTSA